MCLSVYIASDHPLPTVKGDTGQSRFQVEPALVIPDELFRRNFSKPFIYLASPDDGCGCTFLFDGRYDDEGEYVEDDRPEQVVARRGLSDYLYAALRHQAEVEVLTCLSGSESTPPKHRRRARPDDFTRDRTLFRFGDLIVVSEQGTEAGASPERQNT